MTTKPPEARDCDKKAEGVTDRGAYDDRAWRWPADALTIRCVGCGGVVSTIVDVQAEAYERGRREATAEIVAHIRRKADSTLRGVADEIERGAGE